MNILDFLHAYNFYEFTALLCIAATVGYVGILLRQPMIVSFIAVGVLSGPSVTGIVSSHDNIELLGKMGVSLLLFLVGLKLDIKLIRTLGPVALATGLGQVVFTSITGFIIGKFLGYGTMTALYIGVALTFSSTIIIIKLLSDKKEVNSLHGKIAIGFLIVQDIVVVLAMMVLSALGMQSEVPSDDVPKLYRTIGMGFGLFGILWIFSRFFATALMRQIVRSSELIIIFAIAWATFLAAIGNLIGFGIELGGLLAGISLASTPFREAVVTRLSSLRDFLLLFFFIDLGSRLELANLGSQLIPAIIFSVFVLIGNPLIVMTIMGLLGYRKRTSFLAGLTVAQVSEFSLVFISMGLSLGHLKEDSLGLVTLVGLITIALSVYMITYSEFLFKKIGPYLDIFERHIPKRETTGRVLLDQDQHYDVILFGLGRYGRAIAEQLIHKGLKVLGVDYNPEVIRNLHFQKFDVQYGDAHDQEFIHTLPLSGTKWVLSAMPEHGTGLTHEDPKLVLLDGLKRMGFEGKIGLSTYSPQIVNKLREKGADEVFLPYEDAAGLISDKVYLQCRHQYLH